MPWVSRSTSFSTCARFSAVRANGLFGGRPLLIDPPPGSLVQIYTDIACRHGDGDGPVGLRFLYQVLNRLKIQSAECCFCRDGH